MLFGRKCVLEFVLVLDKFLSQNLFWFWTIFYQFLLLHLAPLLWSSSSLFAFYIGDFGWAAPLWLPWPWISEGEKKLLRSEMRSSPPNFPFILFNFEYWIIIVDHFQVMVVMECVKRDLDGQIVQLKEDQMSVCRCDWSIFDLLNHSTNIWSSPLKFVNCSYVSKINHCCLSGYCWTELQQCMKRGRWKTWIFKQWNML